MTKKKMNKRKAKKELQSLKMKVVKVWFRYQRALIMLIFIAACSFAVFQWYTYYYSIEVGGDYFDDVVISQQGVDLNEKKYDELIDRIQQRGQKYGEFIEAGKDVFYDK